jgi:hypothetical protein
MSGNMTSSLIKVGDIAALSYSELLLLKGFTWLLAFDNTEIGQFIGPIHASHLSLIEKIIDPLAMSFFLKRGCVIHPQKSWQMPYFSL